MSISSMQTSWTVSNYFKIVIHRKYYYSSVKLWFQLSSCLFMSILFTYQLSFFISVIYSCSQSIAVLIVLLFLSPSSTFLLSSLCLPSLDVSLVNSPVITFACKLSRYLHLLTITKGLNIWLT